MIIPLNVRQDYPSSSHLSNLYVDEKIKYQMLKNNRFKKDTEKKGNINYNVDDKVYSHGNPKTIIKNNDKIKQRIPKI